MASAMRVFRKFRASDGRIKIATLSGVSTLVAVIALLVGVLPVFASHVEGEEPAEGHPLVEPVQVDWGGGEGACDDDLNSLEDEDRPARGPSAATYEAHLNNPKPGTHEITDDDDPNNTKITITVDEEDEKVFDFSIESDHMGAYDVVVNGGKKSNHYEYDGSGITPSEDFDLSAPTKENKDELHNLSHINICYDVALVNFVCDEPEKLEGEGLITNVTAVIFGNSVDETFECTKGDSKNAFYFIDNDTVTLDFGDDGEADVAGRLDFTKVFLDEQGDPDPDSFEPLEYDGSDNFTGFDDVEWCETRPFKDGDGTEFSDWLTTGTENGSYPELPDGETACKVAEDEDLSGTQVTVVYFEFEDPQFQ